MTGCVRSCTSQLFAGSIVTLNRVDAAMILGSGGLSRSSITQDDTSWVNGGLGVSLGVNVPGGWRRDHEAPVQCLEPCVKIETFFIQLRRRKRLRVSSVLDCGSGSIEPFALARKHAMLQEPIQHDITRCTSKHEICDGITVTVR